MMELEQPKALSEYIELQSDLKKATKEHELLIQELRTRLHAIQGQLASLKERLKLSSSFTKTVARWHMSHSFYCSLANIFLSFVFVIFPSFKEGFETHKTLFKEKLHAESELKRTEQQIEDENYRFKTFIEPFLRGNPRNQEESLNLIKSICGGEEIWKNLPLLDLSKCVYAKHKISFGKASASVAKEDVKSIEAQDMDSLVMKGQDPLGHYFIALSTGQAVQTFFQTSHTGPEWHGAGYPIISLSEVLITSEGDYDPHTLELLAEKIKSLRDGDQNPPILA